MREYLCGGFGWFLLSGTLGVFLAGRLKHSLLSLLTRAFGPRFGLGLYALLTLPGFFLHEAAHLLAALALGVPVRHVTFIPRPDPEGLSLAASVEVIPRGPLRMAAVALAPFLMGTAVLASLTVVFPYAPDGVCPWTRLARWAGSWKGDREFWPLAYAIWAISSHMAPSWSDLRHFWKGALIGIPLLILVGWSLMRLSPGFAPIWYQVCTRLGDGFALAAVWSAACLLPTGVLLWATRGRR